MDLRALLLRGLLVAARLTRTLPFLHRPISATIISLASSIAPPRPHEFSLWSPTSANGRNSGSGADYVGWASMFDRGFTGRHLGPDIERARPSPDQVWEALERKGEMVPAPSTHALLCFFAQWFTDSFLRTDPFDLRRNTSNHEIDLCQVYGLDETSTRALRTGEDGLLKARGNAGEELPPLLFKDGKLDPQFFSDPGFSSLSYLRTPEWRDAWLKRINDNVPGEAVIDDPSRRDYLYALGLDRGGSTILYSAITTIFLREHNRIARELAFTGWDDDRIFETARLINIRQLLGVVIEDYIEHLTGGEAGLLFDRTFAERKRWYRTNRISIEFNLLYRWHSLVPDRMTLSGRTVEARNFRFNNALMEQAGIVGTITAASECPAGRLALGNTPDFLKIPEMKGLQWARDNRLRPFNDYRERFGLARYKRFEDLTGDEASAGRLRILYQTVDDVEFSIGLIAEQRRPGDILPDTLRRMVAYDAFTHILTNPLLSTEIYRPETFSDWGMALIEKRSSLTDIIMRNTTAERARGERLIVAL